MKARSVVWLAGCRASARKVEDCSAGAAASVRTATVAMEAWPEQYQAAGIGITQNQCAAGLSNVKDLMRSETAALELATLLRNETAVLEARTRHLAAINDQRVAAAALELAAGTLGPDSEVLN